MQPVYLPFTPNPHVTWGANVSSVTVLFTEDWENIKFIMYHALRLSQFCYFKVSLEDIACSESSIIYATFPAHL
jgi:hypothetical protein